MNQNFLLLNADKTELFVVGLANHSHHCENQAFTLKFTFTGSLTLKNLRIVFDPQLTFHSHIKAITKSAFFSPQVYCQDQSLCVAETLIRSFISSRLDDYNVLFSGLPKSATRGLQLVQNAAARILTKTRKFVHIPPILASLHWLPILATYTISIYPSKAGSGYPQESI